MQHPEVEFVCRLADAFAEKFGTAKPIENAACEVAVVERAVSRANAQEDMENQKQQHRDAT